MLDTPIDVAATLATFAEGSYVQVHDGLQMWKHPDDLARLKAVIAATKPSVIVETGTKWGGSAAWLAAQGVDVVTVDCNPNDSLEARRRPSSRVTYLFGDSVDPAVLESVKESVGRRKTMVILDSEHASGHVLKEIEAYGPLVSPGCYLVIEDGIFDLTTDHALKSRGGFRIPTEGGPLVAVEKTVANDPAWKRDTQIEALTPLSHNPGGWWIRQKAKR